MIDKVIELMEAAMEWWWGLLDPITSPTTLIIYFVTFSAVGLFFIMRDQYKRCKATLFLEGLEFFMAGFIGILCIGVLYGLPFIIFAAIATLFLSGALSVLQFLVILSVKGVKR